MRSTEKFMKWRLWGYLITALIFAQVDDCRSQDEITVVPPNPTVGQSVLLNISHDKILIINWYRGDGTSDSESIATLNPSSGPQTNAAQFTGRETIMNNGSLMITNLKLSDSGFYTLALSVKDSFLTRKVKLNVNAAPKITTISVHLDPSTSHPNTKFDKYKQKWNFLNAIKEELENIKKSERSGSGATHRPRHRQFKLLQFLTSSFDGTLTEERLEQSPTFIEEESDEIPLSAQSTECEVLRTPDVDLPLTQLTISRHNSTSSNVHCIQSPKNSRETKKIEAEINKNRETTSTFQRLFDFLIDNKVKQQKFEETFTKKDKEDTEQFTLAKSLVPFINRINREFYADLNVEFLNICRKYIAKTNEKKHSENFPPRYNQTMQEFVKPPTPLYLSTPRSQNT